MSRAWPALRGRAGAFVAAWVVALLAVGVTIATLPYRHVSVDEALPAVDEVSRLTMPFDLVVFEGYDWSPALPYYARRTGRMLVPASDPGRTAGELAGDGYRVLVTARLRSGIAADFVRSGRWTGVLGRWVYATGDDLRGAPVAATDEPIPTGAALIDRPLTIACDGATAVLPEGGTTTIVRLAPGTPRTAKLSLRTGLGDVPVRDYVVVNGGPVEVGCRDAPSVTILGVFDGADGARLT